MTSLEFDYEVFEDRLDPIQVQDSISDPNTLGLLQVYYSKDIRTELVKSNQSRKLIKQRRLGVQLSTENLGTFFNKFYKSRAFLRWKHGDRFFNNSKVAGIWPKQYLQPKKQFDPLDIFSAKIYDDLLFGGWKPKQQDIKKEPLFLDILDPEYDTAEINGQSIFDTPMINKVCVPRGPIGTDSSNLLSYINVFNPSGETLENESFSSKTPSYMIASRKGLKSSFNPLEDTPQDTPVSLRDTPQQSTGPKVIFKRKKVSTTKKIPFFGVKK
jgi:hypothetical protein